MVHGRAFDLQHAAIALFSHHDELGGGLEAACGQVLGLVSKNDSGPYRVSVLFLLPQAMSFLRHERVPLGVCVGPQGGGGGVPLVL